MTGFAVHVACMGEIPTKL